MTAQSIQTFAKRAPVTVVVTVMCVLAFFGEAIDAGGYNAFAGDGSSLSPLLAFGVLSQPEVDQGQWWRLITAGFLHFGVIHLALNLYALVLVGMLVEPLYRPRRYAVIYAVALLAGNVVAYLTQGPRTVSAGASGAIMGAFGAMAVLGLRYPIARGYLRSALFPIGATLLYGVINPEVSTAAHLGGLIGGSATAALLNLPPEVRQRLRAAQARAVQPVAVPRPGGDPDGGWPPEVLDDPANRRELGASGRSGWRWRILAVVFGLVGLVLVGFAVLSLAGGDNLGAGQPIALIAGLVLLAWAFELGRPNRDVLLLDPRGFTIKGPPPAAVRWADVQSFGLVTQGQRRRVAFTYAPTTPARLQRTSTDSSASELATLPSTYGLPADELAALLERWRSRWTRPDRGAVPNADRDG